MRLITLLALLLVPIAFSGHQHAGDPPSHPCAVCVVTRHTPTVSAQATPTIAPLTLATTIESSPVATPAAVARHRPTGRGPPWPRPAFRA